MPRKRKCPPTASIGTGRASFEDWTIWPLQAICVTALVSTFNSLGMAAESAAEICSARSSWASSFAPPLAWAMATSGTMRPGWPI